MPKMLDLCSGRLGWAKAFLARGWECTGVDLVAPPEIPAGFTFRKMDILDWRAADVRGYAFACASTPCEEFSVWGMKHYHPNPKYPALGIKLFNHVREIFEDADVPFVMENVRAAQQFVGDGENHVGPFHLWGNAVPPLLPQGITKAKWKTGARAGRPGNWSDDLLLSSSERSAKHATIPPELANCVADYAQRLVLDFGEVR